MKYSLLDMTQTIASSLDLDEVNSISDSVSSLQIANIIKTTYFDIIQRANLPEHYSLVTLDAYIDNTKPNLMTVPESVADVIWIKYDTATVSNPELTMTLLDYQPLDVFLDRMHSLNSLDSDVSSYQHTINGNIFTILYYNDVCPRFYTTFDDHTVLFDGVDLSVDTTLQKSKTMCWARTVIPFSLADTFIPDLDEGQFNLLLNEAKSLAWLELKQSQHGIAERNSKRGWSNLQNKKNALPVVSEFDKLPNFGRR